MEICKNCMNYDDTNSYKGTGYCLLYRYYTKDDDICDDFQEEE